MSWRPTDPPVPFQRPIRLQWARTGVWESDDTPIYRYLATVYAAVQILSRVT